MQSNTFKKLQDNRMFIQLYVKWMFKFNRARPIRHLSQAAAWWEQHLSACQYQQYSTTINFQKDSYLWHFQNQCPSQLLLAISLWLYYSNHISSQGQLNTLPKIKYLHIINIICTSKCFHIFSTYLVCDMSHLQIYISHKFIWQQNR